MFLTHFMTVLITFIPKPGNQKLSLATADIKKFMLRKPSIQNPNKSFKSCQKKFVKIKIIESTKNHQLIGLVEKYPIMHFFGIPKHTSSLKIMILTECCYIKIDFFCILSAILSFNFSSAQRFMRPAEG